MAQDPPLQIQTANACGRCLVGLAELTPQQIEVFVRRRTTAGETVRTDELCDSCFAALQFWWAAPAGIEVIPGLPRIGRTLVEIYRTEHEALDSLLAAFLVKRLDKVPSDTTVLELLEWSNARRKGPVA